MSQQQQQQQEVPQPGLAARLQQNITMARKGYEQLVHAIIRPPRAQYTMQHLGPAEFKFLGQKYVRDDVELLTHNTTYPGNNKTTFWPVSAATLQFIRTDNFSFISTFFPMILYI